MTMPSKGNPFCTLNFPYAFFVKGKKIKPNIMGIYHPETEEEVKELEYQRTQGRCYKLSDLPERNSQPVPSTSPQLDLVFKLKEREEKKEEEEQVPTKEQEEAAVLALLDASNGSPKSIPSIQEKLAAAKQAAKSEDKSEDKSEAK